MQRTGFDHIIGKLANRLSTFERGVIGTFGGQRFERQMSREKNQLRAQIAALTEQPPAATPDHTTISPLNDGAQFTHVVLPSGATMLAEIVTSAPGARSVRLLDLTWNDHTTQLVSEAYGLSPAEIDVCRSYMKHCNLKQVAQDRGTSEGTVRQQFKSIYAKTCTQNQAQLIRSLATACARTQRVANAQTWSDPFGRERLFVDSEGRQIAFTQIGAKDGAPALLVHGPMTGYVLPDEIEEGLIREGITLTAISRPGFGNSDPDPHRSAIDAGAWSIEAVMDHLGITRCPGVGLICGLAPLARFAAQQPERITALIGVGASAPLDRVQFRKALPPLQRVVINLAMLSPKALEVVYLHAVLAVAQSDLSAVLRRMYGQCAPDIACLDDDAIRSKLIDGARLITAQDTKVFLKDLQMMLHPWDADLARTQMRMLMLCGENDPVFPPVVAREMCDDVGAQIDLLPEAGQLVAFQHPQAVLRALRDHV